MSAGQFTLLCGRYEECLLPLSTLLQILARTLTFFCSTETVEEPLRSNSDIFNAIDSALGCGLIPLTTIFSQDSNAGNV